MLKANLEAELEARELELHKIDQDMWKIANIISGLNEQLDMLRSCKTSIESKIDDIKDKMEV